MDLSGKRIIVTGSASGMGAATVRAYVAAGAAVVGLDIDDERGAEVAREAGATYLRCDVADREAVAVAFADAVTLLHGLDVLAHAAGIEPAAPAEDIAEHDWDRVVDVNAKGTMLTNQAAFPSLKEQGGAIINFASAAGVLGQPWSAHYAASKGAVLAWTRTVAREWGAHRIRVNAVAPAIWTPMFDAHRARMSPEALDALDRTMSETIAIGGKLGDPDLDMAPVMVFLASDASRFITGQTVPVDGGLLMLS